jgi:hypothetical protein
MFQSIGMRWQIQSFIKTLKRSRFWFLGPFRSSGKNRVFALDERTPHFLPIRFPPVPWDVAQEFL